MDILTLEQFKDYVGNTIYAEITDSGDNLYVYANDAIHGIVNASIKSPYELTDTWQREDESFGEYLSRLEEAGAELEERAEFDERVWELLYEDYLS